MNKSIIQHLQHLGQYLALGAMGWVSLSQTVVAGEPGEQGAAPQITVYVYNWAEVEPSTLREAKDVVTRILSKAGVDATLLDAPPSSPAENGQAETRLGRSNFFVQILSLPMAEGFGFPTQVLGVAPGDPQELDRDQVYVLDPVAKRMAQEQVRARESRMVFMNATKGQILGHGMAHEIGHVLLRQAAHPPAGLMRAQWNRTDFQDMVGGNLRFTSQEAARLRAELHRRGFTAR